MSKINAFVLMNKLFFGFFGNKNKQKETKKPDTEVWVLFVGRMGKGKIRSGVEQ